jgi:hypothetical protein
MRGKATVVVGVIVLLLAGLAASSSAGRRWLEDRVDSIRWFNNEVRTLTPR